MAPVGEGPTWLWFGSYDLALANLLCSCLSGWYRLQTKAGVEATLLLAWEQLPWAVWL